MLVRIRFQEVIGKETCFIDTLTGGGVDEKNQRIVNNEENETASLKMKKRRNWAQARVVVL